jgi:glutaredoxin
MITKVLLFTQPGCISCELIRFYLEAKETVFEERDISSDSDARRLMTEEHGSHQTPTLVIVSGGVAEVVVGFDPVRLDDLLAPAASSEAVTES